MHQEVIQQAFNKAYKGVIAQGGFATNEAHCCSYRTAGGLKCTVGFLIPDEYYDPQMDLATGLNDTEIHSLMLSEGIGTKMANALVAGGIPKPYEVLQFLMDMQQAHDQAAYTKDIGKFKEGMADLAKKYNLTVPEAS